MISGGSGAAVVVGDAAVLARQRDSLLLQLKDTRNELKGIGYGAREALDSLSAAVLSSRQALDSTLAACAACRVELAHLEKILSEKTIEAESLREKLDEMKMNSQNIDSAIIQVETRVFSDWCVRYGYSNVREYRATLQSVEIATHIAKIEAVLGLERERLEDCQKSVETLEAALLRDTELLSSVDLQVSDVEAQLDRVQSRLVLLNEELNSLDIQIKEKATQCKAAKDLLLEFTKQIESADKKGCCYTGFN